MLIVEIKSGDSIDKAIKKLKKKFEQTRTLKQLRNRKEYKKPSVKRREEINNAIKKKNYEVNE